MSNESSCQIKKHPDIDLYETNKLTRILCKMSEKEFTIKILKPLFEASGYTKVDYHGGNTELGKDLIMWRRDELGEIELTVAQVKKFKMGARVASSTSFASIVTQLTQGINEKVPFGDGKEYLPTRILFITPYQIDTRGLMSAFGPYKLLRHSGLRVLDGPHIIELLRNKYPQLINNILGSTESINIALLKNINNNALMGALESNKFKNIGEIYCDVDFSLGASKKLLQSSIAGNSFDLPVDYENWQKISDFDKIVQTLTKKNIVKIDPSKIETAFKAEIVKLRQAKIKINKIKEQLDKLHLDMNHIVDETKAVIKKNKRNIKNGGFENESTQFINILTKLSETFLQDEIEEEKYRINRYKPANKDKNQKHTYRNDYSIIEKEIVKNEENKRDILKIRKDQENKLIKLEAILIKEIAFPKHIKVLKDLQTKNFITQRKTYIKKLRELEALKELDSEPKVTIKIDAKAAAENLKKQRATLQKGILAFKKREQSLNQLRKLLIQSHDFIQACKNIFSKKNNIFKKKIFQLKEQKSVKSDLKSEISATIHDVFQTGLDVSVLGEAGAGKTTSMQAFWLRNAPSCDDRLYLFAPLASLINYMQEFKNDKSDEIPCLVSGIAHYLRVMGCEVEENDLRELIKKNDSCILIDGIDEVIGSSPWIIKSIQFLKSKYPKAQIITSSRISESFIEKIPFLQVSINQFTKDQLFRFVDHLQFS